MSLRMVRFAAILLLLIWVTPARSGEAVLPAVRKEFKQSMTYPYIFEPVCYLENDAPVPLHFGAPVGDLCDHNPPLLGHAAAKKENPADSGKNKSPAAASAPEPAPSPAVAQSGTAAPDGSAGSAAATAETSSALAAVNDLPTAPAYPPPEHPSSVTQQDSLDMSRYPLEVVEIFKNPYNIPKANKHFFEPVFEPAQKADAPRSEATYRQE